MIATSIMTPKVHTLKPGDTVHAALKLIRDEKIRQVPVIDDDGVVIGVVTPRTLLKAALPGYIGEGFLEDVKFAPEIPEFIKNIEKLSIKRVIEVLDTNYTSVAPDTYTMEVAALFVRKDRFIESILVLDNEKRLLGIISPWDVFKRLCQYTEQGR